jgi:hypothetical protein
MYSYSEERELMKIQPISSYVENGLTINVYPEKKVKRRQWQKNDTFYSAKMRIEDGNGMFANFSRKAGRA